MTDSAARRLAILIEHWRSIPGNQSTEGLRYNEGMDGKLNLWHDHAETIELMREVEREVGILASSGDRTEQFTKYLPALYQFLNGYTIGWRDSTAQPREALPEAAYDMLHSLASVMDSRLESQSFDSDDTELALTLLDELVELLDAEAMDVRSRQYLIALIAELRQAIQDAGRFGSTGVRKLSAELAGLLLAQADTAVDEKDEPRAKRLFGFALRVAGIAGKTGWQTAIAAGVDLTLKQLGVK